MQSSAFREYDIRGKVGTELTIEHMYEVTRSILNYFLQKNSAIQKVIVGMDGRLSSTPIKEQVIAALTDCGIDVVFIGICPSPVLYFGLHTLPVDAGLMITASHNPKEYNGLKILLGTKTIWGKGIKDILSLYQEKKFAPLSKKKGNLKESSLNDSYIRWLKNHFNHLVGISLPMVIDLGNGTGGTILPTLVNEMEWHNVILHCATVDGNYPNHEADPTVEKNMHHVQKTLYEGKALVGFGLDGDCDRMAGMTQEGFLVPGDQLLAIFIQDLIKKYPHTKVVFDIKVSLGLIELLNEWNIEWIMAPCGHSIIKEQMDLHNALIGGELSCHFFFSDRHFGFDDGIYALLRLIEILHKTGKSLGELIAIIPKKFSSPEIRLECLEEKKEPIINYLKDLFQNKADVDLITIDGIRVNFINGWANIRASNTQPVLSMRFEGNSLNDLTSISSIFIEALKPFFDEGKLKQRILNI